MAKINVVPHNSEWQSVFKIERERVAAAFGEKALAVHHIGSTSVPGIYAKPVIDMLVEVNNITEVDTRNPAIESLGYEVMGEFGIPGRRYFRKDDSEGTRTHQIHAFLTGSDQVTRHLAFRDYLTAHPDEALEYSDLKRQLAADHPHDADAYMDGKDSFIQEIDRRAAVWKNAEARPSGRA